MTELEYYSKAMMQQGLSSYSATTGSEMMQQCLSSYITAAGSEYKYSEAVLPKSKAIVSNSELLVDSEADSGIADIDNSFTDPQLCATFARDIYNHLRASEVKKRPSTDYMEKIQEEIDPSMRAILIDWLVEVAVDLRFVPETLYLAVNYIDRYLSGNPTTRAELQLVGVACLMIASNMKIRIHPWLKNSVTTLLTSIPMMRFWKWNLLC